MKKPFDRIRRRLLACCLLVALPVQALDLDADGIVAEHNRWRKTVGAPPLSYSDMLANSAQEWANYLQENNDCKMKHSQSNGQYGENIFWASPELWSDGRRKLQEVTPRHVVNNWANERLDYDYKKNRCAEGKACGHYTQVIWKKTTKVGCAMAVCDDSLEQVWVCQYQPAGNWVGERPY